MTSMTIALKVQISMFLRTSSQSLVSLIFIISLTLSAVPAVGTPAIHPTTLSKFSELKTAIDSLLETYSIPGAGLAIVSKDSILYVEGLGYADVGKNIPVTKDTRFRMGSITKHFVALGFLKLVENGLADLDTPIADIVPEMAIINPWDKTDPVTVAHLLEHTSGIPNSFKEFNVSDDPEIPLGLALEKVSRTFEAGFRPGTCNSYSNTAMGLAGYILEQIAGRRYEDYLREEILTPIGMGSSTFSLRDIINDSLHAAGYKEHYKKSPFVNFYSRPAGVMSSTAADMARYVLFMLNMGNIDGKQIVTRESILRMETPETSQASRHGLQYGFGLGTECKYQRGYKWLGHNGAHFGFYSDFWFNHDLDIGFVILNNRFDFNARKGLREIRSRIFDFLVPEVPSIQTPAVALSESQLSQFTGRYVSKSGSGDLLGWINKLLGDVEISLINDTLTLQPFMGTNSPLIPVSPQLFRKPDEPDASVVFFTTPEGTKALANRNDYHEETPAWKPWAYRIFFGAAWIAMLSTIAYALFWIPVCLYRKITKKNICSPYLRMRLLPLLTVSSILVGLVAVANQDVMYIAEKTFANIIFTASTWLFALLSIVSSYFAVRSFSKPVTVFARVYALIVSLSAVGMALFLGYHGMIGLTLWN